MANASHIQNSFTSGELSPRLAGRTDVEQYADGCDTLLNFRVLPTGGITRRGGTKYVNNTSLSNVPKLLPFEFNVTQAYMLAFLGQAAGIEFYKDQGVLTAETVTGGLTIANGTFDADLASWTASSVTWNAGSAPFNGKAVFASGGTLEQAATISTVSETITVRFTVGGTAGTDTLDLQVGTSSGGDEILALTTFQVGHHSYTFTADATTFYLQFEQKAGTPSVDNVAYMSGTTLKITSPYANFWAGNPGTASRPQFTQSADTMYIAHPLHPPMKLTRTSHTHWSLTEITFTDTPSEWTGTNYPSTVTFYEQRLYWAATPAEPQTIWASKSADYENLTLGTSADDAFTYTIASDRVNKIEWLSPGKVLAVGTAGGEFIMAASSQNEAITPTNVRIVRQSAFGSAAVDPTRLGDEVFFVQRAGKKVRLLAFALEADAYTAADQMVLAEHMSAGTTILEMAYQQEPDTTFWCVLADGSVAALTYEKEQAVVAWHRHVLAGTSDAIGTQAQVVSAAVIPNSTGNEVWFAVKRAAHYSYELLQEGQVFGSPDQEDAFFVDAGLTLDTPITITGATQANPVVITATAHGLSNGNFTKLRKIAGMTELNQREFTVANVTANTFELSGEDGTAHTAYVSGGEARLTTVTITGLTHLEGQTVSVLADGAVRPDAVVASGAITLGSRASIVHAGLGFNSDMKTLRIDAGSVDGSAQGKTKRIHELALRFYKTIGGQFGRDSSNLDTLVFRNFGDAMGTYTPLFTGDKVADFAGGWSTDGQIFIRQNQPLPMTLLAYIAHLQTNR